MSDAASDIPAASVEGVAFTYPGADAAAISGIDLRVEVGERLGVLGPNGGGKSTLIKLMLGLLEPGAGRVAVFGRSPGVARREGLVGYVPQRVTAELAFPLSVRDVVRMPAACGAGLLRRVAEEAEAHVDRVIGLVGLQELTARRIGRLSGGQLQRAMIARAVAAKPRMLLLDEPTVGIDVAGQRQFADMLASLAVELGLTIVTVSHDLRTVALSSDRVACLHRTLHYHDAPQGLTPTVLSELFRHDVEAVFGSHAAGTVNDAGSGAGGGCGCAHD
jgi:zinc transport system ATP-binding protein